MSRNTLAMLVAAGSIAAFAGCESSPSTQPATAPAASPAAMGMLNATCPMTGEPVDPAAPAMEYHGYKIGLCCAGCAKGWDKMTDDEKTAFVTKHAGK